MSDTATPTAEQHLRTLAGRIGAGFHPDTRGADYDSLPDGITAEMVDDIVDDAFAAGVDVYGVALDTVHLAEQLPTVKRVDELQVGDTVTSLETTTFTVPHTVTRVTAFCVYLTGGAFWPFPMLGARNVTVVA